MICTICGFYGEAGPVGPTGARETMLCPWCKCSSRHRATFLAAFMSAPFPRTIYQVGWDITTPFLSSHFTRQLIVSEQQSRAGCVVQDLERLTFASETFGLVFCCDVLEHVTDYDKAEAELARVLSRGGALIVTVPLAPGPDEHHVYGDDAPVHADPLDAHGCKVFRTFGSRKLSWEFERLGLSCTWTLPDIAEHGIVNSAVLVGRKRK